MNQEKLNIFEKKFLFKSNNLYVIINDKGFFEYVNEKFCSLLGYTYEEAYSQPFTNFLHPNDRIASFEAKHNIHTKGAKVFSFKNRYKVKNKDEYKWISWTGWPDDNYVVGIGVINEETQLVSLVSNAQNSYIMKQPNHIVFHKLLAGIIELTGSEYGFIGEVLYDKNDGLPFLKTMAITNIAWNDELHEKFGKNGGEGIVFKNLNTLFGLVLTTKKLVISNDPKFDKRRGAKLKIPEKHPPLKRFCGIPFYFDDKFIGMVGIANSQYDYSDDIVSKYETFLNTCALLINSIRQESRAKATRDIEMRFTSQISHELKTPLNSILGFGQLLKSEVNKEHKEYVDYIIESGQLLMNTINNSLNLNMLDNYSINMEYINLLETINNYIKMQKLSIEKLGLKINVDIDPSIEVYCDNFLLDTILKNFISNGIKYNIPNGDLSIRTDMRNQKLYIIFQNSGKLNIREDKLFQPFETTHKTSGGTGLGLSIVKKIFNIIEQDLTYEHSESSVSFIFTMNYRFKGKKKKILMIEDNKMNQILIKKILSGKDLTIKSDGNEILSYIRDYDILLLDLFLPNMNGFEIITLLKKNKIYINTIMITADTNTETLKQINKMNIKYFTKPLNVSEFRDYINNLLEN
jgi:PAS domain S-box-containing protein